MHSEEGGDKQRVTWMDRAIGLRLKEIRKQVGMTQEELGRALKMSFQQVQKYEKGLNRISAVRLFAIARALQVPYNLFFTGMQPNENQVAGLLSDNTAPYNPPSQPLDDLEKKEILNFFEEIPTSRARRSVLKGLRDLSRSLSQ